MEEQLSLFDARIVAAKPKAARPGHIRTNADHITDRAVMALIHGGKN